MTDQEILEKYQEVIEEDINRWFEKLNIENDIEKQTFTNGYRKGFVEGFREGSNECAREIAKRLIRENWVLEEVHTITQLTIEVIQKLAAEVAREPYGEDKKGS